MKTARYSGLMLIATCALSLASAIRGQNTAPETIASGQLSLMPMPASVQMQTGRLPITGSFSVAIRNYTDDRLRAAIARMRARLAGRTVMTLPVDRAPDESHATLVVLCERAGETIPSVDENESYSLEVNEKQA